MSERHKEATATSTKVPPQLLRLPLPYLPYNAPHAIMHRLFLRLHQLPWTRSAPAHPLQEAVPQDLRSQRNLLLLHHLRQHLPLLPPRLLQLGHRRNDVVLHHNFCVFDHMQEGDWGGLPRAVAGGVRYRCGEQQWSGEDITASLSLWRDGDSGGLGRDVRVSIGCICK